MLAAAKFVTGLDVAKLNVGPALTPLSVDPEPNRPLPDVKVEPVRNVNWDSFFAAFNFVHVQRHKQCNAYNSLQIVTCTKAEASGGFADGALCCYLY